MQERKWQDLILLMTFLIVTALWAGARHEELASAAYDPIFATRPAADLQYAQTNRHR